jgi:hypothetical protein
VEDAADLVAEGGDLELVQGDHGRQSSPRSSASARGCAA